MDPNDERVLRSNSPAEAPSASGLHTSTSEAANSQGTGRPQSAPTAADNLNLQRFKHLRGVGSSPSNNASGVPGRSAFPGAGGGRTSRALPVDSMVFFNTPPGRGPGQPPTAPGHSRLAEQSSAVSAADHLGSMPPQQPTAPRFPQPRRSSLPNPVLKRTLLQPHAPLSPPAHATATPWHGRRAENAMLSPRSGEQNTYTTPYKNVLVGPAQISDSMRADMGPGVGTMTSLHLDDTERPSVLPARRHTYPNIQPSSVSITQKLSMTNPVSGGLGIGLQRLGQPISQVSPGMYRQQERNNADGVSTERSGMSNIGSSSGPLPVSGTLGQVPAEDSLEQAILDQDVDKVSWLLEEGQDPNRSGSATKCPLLIAAVASGNERMLKTLLAAGANTEIKDSKQCSALHHATARGFRSLVKVLLVAGADLYAKTERGHLPVQLASDNRVHQLLASRMQAAMDDRIHQSQLSLPDSPSSPVTPRQWPQREFAGHYSFQAGGGVDQLTDDSYSTAGSSSSNSVDSSAKHSRQGSAELLLSPSRTVIPLHFYEDTYSPQHSPRSPQSRGLSRQESLLKNSSMDAADKIPAMAELSKPSKTLDGQSQEQGINKGMRLSTAECSVDDGVQDSVQQQGPISGMAPVSGGGSSTVRTNVVSDSQAKVGFVVSGTESFRDDEEDDDVETLPKGGRFNLADTLMLPTWRLKSLRRGSADQLVAPGQKPDMLANEDTQRGRSGGPVPELPAPPLPGVSNLTTAEDTGSGLIEEAESSSPKDTALGLSQPLTSVLKGDGKAKAKERKSVKFAPESEPSDEDLALIREDWHDAACAGCVGCGKVGCGGQCLPAGKGCAVGGQASASSSQSNVSSPFIWTRGELLGEGAYGKVFAGLNQSTGELMAVKQLKLDQLSEGQEKTFYLDSLEREIALYKKMRHKHIVGYINVEKDETTGSVFIFLEYVSGGSMQSMLERFGRFSEPLVRVYTRQLLLGLEYLHANKIVHRDIKGGNVLVDADGVVKLADFGASKAFHDPTQTNGCQSIRGSVFWMAPEVIKGDGYGRRADIWSVGCTVIEMLTASHPWPGMDNTWTAIFHIAKASAGPPIPEEASGLARSFLDQCFQLDPKLRPTASELLLHPFVTPDGSLSAT